MDKFSDQEKELNQMVEKVNRVLYHESEDSSKEQDIKNWVSSVIDDWRSNWDDDYESVKLVKYDLETAPDWFLNNLDQFEENYGYALDAEDETLVADIAQSYAEETLYDLRSSWDHFDDDESEDDDDVWDSDEEDDDDEYWDEAHASADYYESIPVNTENHLQEYGLVPLYNQIEDVLQEADSYLVSQGYTQFDEGFLQNVGTAVKNGAAAVKSGIQKASPYVKAGLQKAGQAIKNLPNSISNGVQKVAQWGGNVAAKAQAAAQAGYAQGQQEAAQQYGNQPQQPQLAAPAAQKQLAAPQADTQAQAAPEQTQAPAPAQDQQPQAQQQPAPEQNQVAQDQSAEQQPANQAAPEQTQDNQQNNADQGNNNEGGQAVEKAAEEVKQIGQRIDNIEQQVNELTKKGESKMNSESRIQEYKYNETEQLFNQIDSILQESDEYLVSQGYSQFDEGLFQNIAGKVGQTVGNIKNAPKNIAAAFKGGMQKSDQTSLNKQQAVAQKQQQLDQQKAGIDAMNGKGQDQNAQAAAPAQKAKPRTLAGDPAQPAVPAQGQAQNANQQQATQGNGGEDIKAVKQVSQDIKALNQKVDKLEKQVGEAAKQKESKINSGSRLTEASLDYTQLNLSKTGDLSRTLSILNANKARTQKQINASQAQINALQAQIDALNATGGNAQAKAQKIQDLENQKAPYTQQIATYQQKIAKYDYQIRSIQNELQFRNPAEVQQAAAEAANPAAAVPGVVDPNAALNPAASADPATVQAAINQPVEQAATQTVAQPNAQVANSEKEKVMAQATLVNELRNGNVVKQVNSMLGQINPACKGYQFKVQGVTPIDDPAEPTASKFKIDFKLAKTPQGLKLKDSQDPALDKAIGFIISLQEGNVNLGELLQSYLPKVLAKAFGNTLTVNGQNYQVVVNSDIMPSNPADMDIFDSETMDAGEDQEQDTQDTLVNPMDAVQPKEKEEPKPEVKSEEKPEPEVEEAKEDSTPDIPFVDEEGTHNESLKRSSDSRFQEILGLDKLFKKNKLGDTPDLSFTIELIPTGKATEEKDERPWWYKDMSDAQKRRYRRQVIKTQRAQAKALARGGRGNNWGDWGERAWGLTRGRTL